MPNESENRGVVLRDEIERIKTAILLTRNIPERAELYARLGTCMREYLTSIDQRIHAVEAAPDSLQEHHCGM
jgi:hypothetical protein